ncbi:MAG: hypothetical protein ACXVB9_08205 [Bdellovibrionota bacterium]
MGELKEERKFLHDLASPLTSLQLNLENVMTLLEDGEAADFAGVKTMVESGLKQIKKMTMLVGNRREVLIKETEGK